MFLLLFSFVDPSNLSGMRLIRLEIFGLRLIKRLIEQPRSTLIFSRRERIETIPRDYVIRSTWFVNFPVSEDTKELRKFQITWSTSRFYTFCHHFLLHYSDPKPAKMIIARRFSLTNFFIATSALGFQVFVLYPWHKRLDDDFLELKAESLKVLRGGEKARLAELLEIKEEIRGLKKK